MTLACRICRHSDGNRLFNAREMMFGTRERFDYFECVDCGCVQIVDIPADLSPYYPKEYYSFAAANSLRQVLKGAWLCDPFPWKARLQRTLSFLPGVRLMPRWMSHPRLPRTASVLDAGTGHGERLFAMHAAGFRDLTGSDPFIKEDITYPNGIRVLKRRLAEVGRAFDWVMMHHAFEHMPEPAQTLIDANQALKPDGILLIRIPVAAWAWHHYGVNWFALDPPRHLFLHTLKSLTLAAAQAGLEIADFFFDSDEVQFIGSELYQRDIPMNDPRSYFRNRRTPLFTAAQIRHFAKKAKRLNLDHQGDSAAFYLRKKK